MGGLVTPGRRTVLATMLNKVPEVTVAFWIIKILSTTVGETGADYLAVHVGLGTLVTDVITLTLLLASLIAQFAAREYIPWRYWLAVVLLSVVGTQITDFLTDNLEVSLYVSTAAFAVCLAVDLRNLVLDRADALDPLDRHASARGASTGWQSCSPSLSALPRATSPPRR